MNLSDRLLGRLGHAVTMSKSGSHRTRALPHYRSARSVLKPITQKIEEVEPAREEPRELLDRPVQLFSPKRPDSVE